MKAKDLRVNNSFVKVNKNVLKVDLTILKCINNDENFAEPILLTEKWLVDFGFKQNYYKLFLFGSFEYNLNANTLIFNTSNNQRLVINRNIDYVHQLQNLYFGLTGEELKINERTNISI